MPNKKDPCKAFACRIQACLDKHDYQEEKCLPELEQMRRCCLIHSAISRCCSGISLDRRYSPDAEYKGFRTENNINMHDNPYASRTVRRSWIQRNPRLFASVTITSSMLILFSRPIYDAFIRDDLVPAPPRLRK